MSKLVIFTDLDGTLIDYGTFSYDNANSALALVKAKNIPLVFCTSKTRAEIQYYLSKMNLNEPFISENGGGIYIPRDYFDFDIKYDSVIGGHFLIKLGEDYPKIREALVELKKEFQITGFGDMSPEELQKDCGIPIDQAVLAKQRDFVETFRFEGDSVKLKSAISKLGFNYSRANKYHYIMGHNDKGKAVTILLELFRKKFGKVTTIGIGDSLNDVPMLENVDKAYVVKRPDGNYDKSVENFSKVQGVGAAGWNMIVSKILENDTKENT